MIRFACPQCQKALQVADSAAGKKLKCPQCGGVLAIPAGKQARGCAAQGRAASQSRSPPQRRCVAGRAKTERPLQGPRA